jgi:hypothetical protein
LICSSDFLPISEGAFAFNKLGCAKQKDEQKSNRIENLFMIEKF